LSGGEEETGFIAVREGLLRLVLSTLNILSDELVCVVATVTLMRVLDLVLVCYMASSFIVFSTSKPVILALTP